MPPTSSARSASPTRSNPRLEAMLSGPIVPTVVKLAWPNLLMTFAQSSTGLLESWYLSRLGTTALAGAALVVPVLMLMQNLSGGAMGGGISSAVARQLGARNEAGANQTVLQAVLLNGALGLVFTVLLLVFGRLLYGAMGGHGETLEAALSYSDAMAAGLVFMWVMNALASVVRGTGNMVVPGLVVCGGALILVLVAPLLIFGLGPVPSLGMAGAGLAITLYYGAGSLVLAWYCITGRSHVRLSRGPLRWPLMRNILSVGALASINPFITNGLIASITGLVGAYAGHGALAGFGTAARVEFLVLPLAFGVGAPLVAMVASNLGAGHQHRALRIALAGGGMAFALAETIGLAAAIWPHAWMKLFGSDPEMVEAGALYLRIVGPFFGFFGMGFTLYFASQGAGRLGWPLLSGLTRFVVAVAGGWLAIAFIGSLGWLYAASALAMLLYGVITLAAIASGVWFRQPRSAPLPTGAGVGSR